MSQDAFTYPTIAELLRLPVFAGYRVLAGEENLSRSVVGVNATDVPDYYSWVAEGELLVSSCYSMRDDAAEQERFIARLAERGLAGVCVKFSRYFDEVPECILRAAKERGFPLIELVPDVRFAELSRAVSEEIARRRTSVLKSALSVNQLLTQMITVGASLDEIAETVSEISGSSVLIVDEVNHRQGSFSPNGEKLDEDEMNEGSVCHQICIEDYRVGKLCLWGGHTPLSEAVLSQILQVIPLEISRSHAVRETENSSFTDFFSICSPTASSTSSLSTSAPYRSGLTLRASMCCFGRDSGVRRSAATASFFKNPCFCGS